MLLDVPFYPNTTGDGKQCMQISAKCALEYYLNKKIDLDELDRLTKRNSGKWTYTSQIVSILWEHGLDVKYYSKESIDPFSKDVKTAEDFIRKNYGPSAEKILTFSDLPVVVAASKEANEKGLFEQKQLTFSEIEQHIHQNHLPLMLVDWHVLEKMNGLYQGHFIPVVGYSEDSVYYHESGPKDPTPNRKVSKKDFVEAWNAQGTDNDVIIVFGKRK